MPPKKTKTARPRKYPGHRSCFNHEILFEMFKRDIPELCPSCFASTAKHQVQLIALGYARTFLVMNKLLDMKDEIAELENRICELEEKVTP